MTAKDLLAAALVVPALSLIPAAAEPLAIGAPLPAVTVPAHDGKDVDLARAGAAGWTLVYFYPKADTPGCTRQACSLRDAWDQLTAKGVKVFGVSLDGVDAQRAFRTKHKLPFTLLADKGARLADAFGVPHLAGFAKRQAFLFKNGKLAWRDLDAPTAQQAAEVLAALD